MPQLSAKLMQRKELHDVHSLTNIVRHIKEEEMGGARSMYEILSGKT